MKPTPTYSIRTIVPYPFEEAVQHAKNLLSEEGFGILSEIDVQATLKKKLDVDYPSYVILGACHPESAYKTLQEEKEIGLLLPCNVIVYEEEASVIVAAVRPSVAMGMVANPQLADTARAVEEKLERIIGKLSVSNA